MSLPSHQLIRVENRTQKLERDDLSEALLMTAEDEWADKECTICKSTDSNHDDVALICDGCHSIYHTFCIGLDAVPEDDEWYCPQCNSPLIENAENAESTESTDSSTVTMEDSMKREYDEFVVDDGESDVFIDDDDEEDWTPNSNNGRKRRRKSRQCPRKKRKIECMKSEGEDVVDPVDCTLLHQPGLNVKCGECDELFYFHVDFMNHMRMKHGISHPYHCPRCSNTYSSRESLIRHCSIQHNKNQCSICEKEFSDKRDLRDHIARLHNEGEPQFECADCQRRYYLQKDLDKHRKTHGKQSFPCDECSKTFKTRGSLKEHLEYTHSNRRKFRCKVCFVRFKRKNSLLRHIRLFH